MADNYFLRFVYGIVSGAGYNTTKMTRQEVINKFNELEENENKKDKEMANTFEEQVNAVLDGTYKNSHITMCEETPKILQEIGIPNKPILMTAKHAYLAINKEGKYVGNDDHYHDLGKKLFLDLPYLLKSPVLVFQNIDKKGKIIKDEIVIVVNAIDKDKKPVILPLKVEGRGNINYLEVDANIAKSVYGRKNFQDYIDKHVTEQNLLLIENKKIRSLKP